MSNNTETSLDEQEAMLRAEAQQADADGIELENLNGSISEDTGVDADPVEDGNEEQDTNTNPSEDDSNDSETSNQEDEGIENPEDEDTQDADTSTQPKDTNSEGKLTKAQKEEMRRDKSWKKLEEEKAALAREKAEWETQKAIQNQQQAQAPTMDSNALANAFDEIARQFEEAGDFDKADEAKQKAQELRANPQPQQTQASSNPQFQAAWSANLNRALTEFPEMQDTNSDFGKTVQALLKAPDTAQYFNSRADGVYVAAQLTKMKMTALRVPALEKENASLKEEIKKLRQGMSIPDTGAQGRSGEAKSFESLSLAEQEKFLRRQAEEADASRNQVI
jgi:hypothetical protein